MENGSQVEECVELMNRLVVIRSFMGQNSRRKLKKLCNDNQIKHLLARKDLPELVNYTISNRSSRHVVLECDEPKRRQVVTNSKDLNKLIKNCRSLIKNDLPMN